MFLIFFFVSVCVVESCFSIEECEELKTFFESEGFYGLGGGDRQGDTKVSSTKAERKFLISINGGCGRRHEKQSIIMMRICQPKERMHSGSLSLTL